MKLNNNILSLKFTKQYRGCTTAENYQRVVSLSNAFFSKQTFPNNQTIEDFAADIYEGIKRKFYKPKNVLPMRDLSTKQSAKLLDSFFNHIEMIHESYSMRVLALFDFCDTNRNSCMGLIYPIGSMTFDFQTKVELNCFYVSEFVDLVEELSEGMNLGNIKDVTLRKITAKIEG